VRRRGALASTISSSSSSDEPVAAGAALASPGTRNTSPRADWLLVARTRDPITDDDDDDDVDVSCALARMLASVWRRVRTRLMRVDIAGVCARACVSISDWCAQAGLRTLTPNNNAYKPMLTAGAPAFVRTLLLLVLVCGHAARALGAAARLMHTSAVPRQPAAADSARSSNVRDVLRAARAADTNVDAVRQAAAAASNESDGDAEFEVTHHGVRVPQLSAAAMARLAALCTAAVIFCYATYQTSAAVLRRRRAYASQMSVPIDYKNVKRLFKAGAASQ
jgi:hypothetical protein